MLLQTELQRIFLFNNNGTDITLDDPNPDYSEQEVLNWYANTYSILTTATIEGPEYEDDKYVYKFVTTIGTKG